MEDGLPNSSAPVSDASVRALQTVNQEVSEAKSAEQSLLQRHEPAGLNGVEEQEKGQDEEMSEQPRALIMEHNITADKSDQHHNESRLGSQSTKASDVKQAKAGESQEGMRETATSQSENASALEKIAVILGTNVITKEYDVDFQVKAISEPPNFTSVSSEDTESQPPHSYEEPQTPETEDFRLVVAGSEEKIHTVQTNIQRKVQLKAADVGPKMYDVTGNMVTAPFIAGRLPDAFESLQTFQDGSEGRTASKMLRDFVGGDLNDEEFEKLGMYCSPDNLRTGSEITMPSKYPKTGFRALVAVKEQMGGAAGARRAGDHLHTLRKRRLVAEFDRNHQRNKKFKYRGIRFIDSVSDADGIEDPLPPLVPGKDILYRVRIYRPFNYSPREKLTICGRCPVFLCDLLLLGRHTLTQLRERITCINDEGLRVDLAPRPDYQSLSSCKELFPSGFLFINNVFYVDRRAGCSDISATTRAWARTRRIGDFPVADMDSTRIDQLTVRLGHPEVYVHQGNCEHLFTFSEIRLVGPGDRLSAELYPFHSTAASYNCVYCTTCAEFPANWVVTGSSRVPFDPALFCDTCLRLYMYSDGNMIGDFRAFRYAGNEMDALAANCD